MSGEINAGDLFTSNKGGTILVIDYHNSYNVEILFVETMYETTVRADHLRTGKVKDKLMPLVYGVGYIGDGDFTSIHIAHTYWCNMLKRCYSHSDQKRRPTYIGCTVCEEWCNFQNFAKWYYNNYPTGRVGYHLDKDIKVKGNRVYSPETCMFVSGKENSVEAFAKYYKFINPNGELVEIYNLDEFCRVNKLKSTCMRSVFAGKITQYSGWTIPTPLSHNNIKHNN